MGKEVLIGAVTSERHEHLLKDYVDMVDSFTYPHSLLLVDTTCGTTRYYNKLKKMGLDVLRYDWKPEERHCWEMMVDSKNMLRDKFLENGYDFYFSLDTDEFLPENALTKLVEHDKDNVGYPTPMWHGVPAVFSEGGYIQNKKGGFTLAHYTWEELFTLSRNQKTPLVKVHSVGVGCLLSKKKVFEKFIWATPHFPMLAEDTIFYINVDKFGFETYVDMSIVPLHLCVGWTGVPTWDSMHQRKMQVMSLLQNEDDNSRPEQVEYFG